MCNRDIASESCKTCIHWDRRGKKSKDGWCHAWSPAAYHTKRGHGGSRYWMYSGNGVAAREDEWCARYRERKRRGQL